MEESVCSFLLHIAFKRGGRQRFMKKRTLDYLKRIDEIVKEDSSDTLWEEVMEEHLTQIAFFQHERLIHLLVTILFALIAFITMVMMTIQFSFPVLALFVAILVLLVPYINHYYLLENSVQKMYKQYDSIRRKVVASRRK